MTQFHKRGLFDRVRDTVFYYRTNDACTDCVPMYGKAHGFVINGVVYVIRPLSIPCSITEPMVYEEDFDDITAEDYKKLGTDYIAVHSRKNAYGLSDIVSYRRYDGLYFPSAPSYLDLFKVK